MPYITPYVRHRYSTYCRDFRILLFLYIFTEIAQLLFLSRSYSYNVYVSTDRFINWSPMQNILVCYRYRVCSIYKCGYDRAPNQSRFFSMTISAVIVIAVDDKWLGQKIYKPTSTVSISRDCAASMYTYGGVRKFILWCIVYIIDLPGLPIMRIKTCQRRPTRRLWTS